MAPTCVRSGLCCILLRVALARGEGMDPPARDATLSSGPSLPSSALQPEVTTERVGVVRRSGPRQYDVHRMSVAAGAEVVNEDVGDAPVMETYNLVDTDGDQKRPLRPNRWAYMRITVPRESANQMELCINEVEFLCKGEKIPTLSALCKAPPCSSCVPSGVAPCTYGSAPRSPEWNANLAFDGSKSGNAFCAKKDPANGPFPGHGFLAYMFEEDRRVDEVRMWFWDTEHSAKGPIVIEGSKDGKHWIELNPPLNTRVADYDYLDVPLGHQVKGGAISLEERASVNVNESVSAQSSFRACEGKSSEHSCGFSGGQCLWTAKGICKNISTAACGDYPELGCKQLVQCEWQPGQGCLHRGHSLLQDTFAVQWNDEIVIAHSRTAHKSAGCGWYGCRVGFMDLDKRTGSRELRFAPGGSHPASLLLRPLSGAIGDRSGCIRWGDRVVIAAHDSGQRRQLGACGQHGCSVAHVRDGDGSLIFKPPLNQSYPESFILRKPVEDSLATGTLPWLSAASQGECILWNSNFVLARSSNLTRTKDCGWYGCRVAFLDTSAMSSQPFSMRFGPGGNNPGAFVLRKPQT